MPASTEANSPIEESQPPVITVGVDGTAAGDAALHWALDEATLRGDRIKAVRIWPDRRAAGGSNLAASDDLAGDSSARDEVDAALVRVGYHDQVPLEIESGLGSPKSSLRDETEAADAELVVIGQTSESPAHELLFGSVAHALRHTGIQPVAVIPPAGDDTPALRHRIVVGVDGSARSQVGLQWALTEAALRQADIRAVFVWDEASPHLPLGAVPVVPDSEPTAQAQAAAIVASQVETALRTTSVAVPVTAVAVRGSASVVLLQEAREADLLVLGDHNRLAFRDVILGTTTRACLRHTSTPTVIVPDPFA